jgi:hypothetical protein
MKKTFIENISDPQYKEMLLDSLCSGVTESSKLRDILEYVISNKLELFTDVKFNTPTFEDEDESIMLILPCIKRVYGKVFIDYPDIFTLPKHLEKVPNSEFLFKRVKDKLELFQLYFDIDEFIQYLLDIFPKVSHALSDLMYLDRTNETLSLIVDNYVAMLIKKVNGIGNNVEILLSEIRDAKLNKLQK